MESEEAILPDQCEGNHIWEQLHLQQQESASRYRQLQQFTQPPLHCFVMIQSTAAHQLNQQYSFNMWQQYQQFLQYHRHNYQPFSSHHFQPQYQQYTIPYECFLFQQQQYLFWVMQNQQINYHNWLLYQQQQQQLQQLNLNNFQQVHKKITDSRVVFMEGCQMSEQQSEFCEESVPPKHVRMEAMRRRLRKLNTGKGGEILRYFGSNQTNKQSYQKLFAEIID